MKTRILNIYFSRSAPTLVAGMMLHMTVTILSRVSGNSEIAWRLNAGCRLGGTLLRAIFFNTHVDSLIKVVVDVLYLCLDLLRRAVCK